MMWGVIPVNQTTTEASGIRPLGTSPYHPGVKLFIKPLKNRYLSFQQPPITKHCYHHLDFQENLSFGAFGLWRFQVNLSNARKPVRLRRSSDSWRYLQFLPANLPVVRVALSGWGVFLNWIVEMNRSFLVKQAFRSNEQFGQGRRVFKEKTWNTTPCHWLVKVAQCTRESCGQYD